MRGIKYEYSGLIENKFISERELKRFIIKKGNLLKEKFDKKRKEGCYGFMKLPYQKTEEIKEYARKNLKWVENFVVLGIGGSGLGNIAIKTALKSPVYNMLTKKERNGCPRLFVIDNIDPDLFVSVINHLDLKKTLFNVITKSGTTAETMSQFFIIYKLLKDKLGENKIKKHIVCTTDPEKGELLKIAKKNKLKTFFIPPDVGGRFSVLSPVGLLFSAFAGLDIDKMLKGARDIDTILQKEDIFEIPPLLNAIIHYISDIKYKKKISVMFGYSNRFTGLIDWYRQLWAESLGKMYNKNGKKVLTGQTPVRAIGTTDQHSQIQLYNEGPKDKIITFLVLEKFPEDITIPRIFPEIKKLDYLKGKKMSKLINTAQLATEKALNKYGVFNCKIIFPSLNEYTVGQFFYFYEVQTAFAGELYNINAFDQPGVEEGKKNLKEMLQ